MENQSKWLGESFDRHQNPSPEPLVAPQKIILVPSKETQNPQNATRISTGINQQKPASTPGSLLQPKRGRITVGDIHQTTASNSGSPLQPKRGPISGNQMERGKISGEPESGLRKTANLGPKQATEIPRPTQSPQNAQRISTGIHQKPVSNLGSTLQPKRGPVKGKYWIICSYNFFEMKLFGCPLLVENRL